MKHEITVIETLVFGESFYRVTFGRGDYMPNGVGHTINHRQYNARLASQRRLATALLNAKRPYRLFGGAAQVIVLGKEENGVVVL